MLLKVAAYASVITLFTALYFLRKTKLRSNYCNVERFKCESIPHIACSYNVSTNFTLNYGKFLHKLRFYTLGKI